MYIMPGLLVDLGAGQALPLQLLLPPSRARSSYIVTFDCVIIISTSSSSSSSSRSSSIRISIIIIIHY